MNDFALGQPLTMTCPEENSALGWRQFRGLVHPTSLAKLFEQAGRDISTDPERQHTREKRAEEPADKAQRLSARQYYTTCYGDSLERLDVEGVRRALKEGADPNELALTRPLREWRNTARASGLDVVGISPLSRVVTDTLIPTEEGEVTRQFEEKVIAVLRVLFDAGAKFQSSDNLILHLPAIKGARLSQSLF